MNKWIDADKVNLETVPSAKPTICGYNIEHLELIARVLQKENLPPERVAEALADIGRIVSMVRDECEESLRKAVEQCKINELPAADVAPVRHGRWEQLHGYVTPGGDPVWCCSECGKGIHVWGVEGPAYGGDIADHQWVACPNCGSKMDA